MKIEKINDSQIRCTLTSEDLESRKIRLSELAYGTEKAKSLFQDMMQQAHTRFGFETGNSPLMIEAIPLSSESIVLIITKVDDPDELDARFSRFSPSEASEQKNPLHQFTGADDILDLFHKIHEEHQKRKSADASESEEANSKKADTSEKQTVSGQTEPVSDTPEVNLIQAFRFPSMADAIRGAKGLNGFYNGKNMLVKEDATDSYLLILHQSDLDPDDFNRVCNILTEYGSGFGYSAAAEAHILEHGNIILRKNALQILSDI